MGTFENPEIVQEERDILLIGGGMACCGAAYEMMRWAETGQELRIKLVDKAAMDRSGAVAQGLSAINTYIGTEQDPADYTRMVSNDLMGITRDDLAYDLGRHVDESVHLFEEWGLPIWKTDADGVRHDGAESIKEGLPTLKDGGKPVRSGKWQNMINGESYRWIVAEAAKKALGLARIEERVFIVKLVTPASTTAPTRISLTKRTGTASSIRSTTRRTRSGAASSASMSTWSTRASCSRRRRTELWRTGPRAPS